MHSVSERSISTALKWKIPQAPRTTAGSPERTQAESEVRREEPHLSPH